jgi:polyisoprenoid-binding protein YceI
LCRRTAERNPPSREQEAQRHDDRLIRVSKVRGRFTFYDVTIVTSEDPLDSSVAATIDLASIDTGNEPRDHHTRQQPTQ